MSNDKGEAIYYGPRYGWQNTPPDDTISAPSSQLLMPQTTRAKLTVTDKVTLAVIAVLTLAYLMIAGSAVMRDDGRKTGAGSFAAASSPTPWAGAGIDNLPTVDVTTQPPPAEVDQPTIAPATTPTKAPVKKVAPSMEDGLYHVGEDIPAGTYRLAEPVAGSDFCYWNKSKDAEGEDIIDNDLASSGRLQVTLKKGQWFDTQRCGTWVKR